MRSDVLHQRCAETSSPRDFGFDEFREKDERFLPAEIASLGGMPSGTPSCTMFNSVPQDTFFKDDRRLHFSGQIRVVEFVRVANALVGHQFEISPPKEWLWPVVKFVNDIL